jgi:hypothetical protein
MARFASLPAPLLSSCLKNTVSPSQCFFSVMLVVLEGSILCKLWYAFHCAVSTAFGSSLF